MFEQRYDFLISDRYIPNISYHDDNSAVALIAKEDDKKLFLWETAEYYSKKEIPIIFLCSQEELAETMKPYKHFDQLDDKDITFHDFSLRGLSWLIDKARERFRPIIIALNDLPETPDSETEDLLDFAEQMEAYHIQVIMFAKKRYDYIEDRMPIARMGYIFKKEEEHILMVDFNEHDE